MFINVPLRVNWEDGRSLVVICSVQLLNSSQYCPVVLDLESTFGYWFRWISSFSSTVNTSELRVLDFCWVVLLWRVYSCESLPWHFASPPSFVLSPWICQWLAIIVIFVHPVACHRYYVRPVRKVVEVVYRSFHWTIAESVSCGDVRPASGPLLWCTCTGRFWWIPFAVSESCRLGWFTCWLHPWAWHWHFFHYWNLVPWRWWPCVQGADPQQALGSSPFLPQQALWHAQELLHSYSSFCIYLSFTYIPLSSGKMN